MNNQPYTYVKCPACGAAPKKACKNDGRTRGGQHTERLLEARRIIEDAPFLILAALDRIERLLSAIVAEDR